MKFLIVIMLLFTTQLWGQINPELLVNIHSIDSTEMLAITPAESGVLCYNTDADALFYWDGNNWVLINPFGNDWRVDGNNGTNSNDNFLGTKDAQELSIRTNEIERARVGEGNANFTALSIYAVEDQQAYTGTTTGLAINGDLGQDGMPGQASTLNNYNGLSNMFYNRSGSTVNNNVFLNRWRLWNINGSTTSNVEGVYLDFKNEGVGSNSTNTRFLHADLRTTAGAELVNYYGMEHSFSGNPTVTNFYGLYFPESGYSNIVNYYGFYQGNLGTDSDRFAFYYSGDGSNTYDVAITGRGRLGVGTNDPMNTVEINSNQTAKSGLTFTNMDSGTESSEGSPIGVNGDGEVINNPLFRVQTKSANYTLQLSDHNTVIEFNSATEVVCTIPSTLPTGFQVSITQLGSGRVRFVGSGVTVRNAYELNKTAKQYSKAGVEIASTGDAIISGDLSK